MVTRGSSYRVIRKQLVAGNRGMIEGVHVGNNEINSLISIGVVVDNLTKLRRQEKDVVWLVAIKVPKEQELGIIILGFEQVISH